MIAIVDYGRGNLFGLGHALASLGLEYRVTADATAIRAAERIILPGVGAFGAARDDLDRRGLIEVLIAAARDETPILGICLGMQLLVDESEEFGRHEGLGLIAGRVCRLPEGETRIPNVGWRTLAATGSDPALAKAHGKMVYFNHSYGVTVADPRDMTLSISVNGRVIAAGISRGRVAGFQFHPEKSGPPGLALLNLVRDL
jgi:glutamine amidotransferase